MMIIKKSQWVVKATLIAFIILDAEQALGSAVHTGTPDCSSGLRQFNPLIHKPVYKVGVHATGEIEEAVRGYNLTFEQYLTATAGRRFQPPIEFKMEVTTAPILDWVDRRKETNVDFLFADTGEFSCVGVEMGAEALATLVSHVEVRGLVYDLDVIGGVIFTRADNLDINTISDLTNKTIAALKISNSVQAQAQFYVMHRNGQDFVMDPKQVVFTVDKHEIVRGVARGDYDVGFTRTGIIESTTDESGVPYDPELFKVLEPKIYILDDGNLFPFLHSTPVIPEWPLAATTNVPSDVAAEVQDALIKLAKYQHVGAKMNDCKHELCEGGKCTNGSSPEVCDTAPPEYFDPDSPCDTTRELAQLAYAAGIAGGHTGFRPPRSYFELRTMQEALGFLRQDTKGNWKCTRAESLYGGITCPKGHYKLVEQEFDISCSKVGLPCPEGMECYCQPCVKAFEVEVFEYSRGRGDEYVLAHGSEGCEKMSLCGTVEQTKTMVFHVLDNKEREDAVVTVLVHLDETSTEMAVHKVANESYTYEFDFSRDTVGVGIMEVFINSEQIPESPFRVQIIERNCDIDYPGKGKTATEYGTCECGSGTIDISGECLSSSTFAIIISCILLVLASELGYLFLRYKRRKSDEMWLVSVEELHFGEPVEIVGQGSFGVVLLAEYRGTKVAIKRALPPSSKGASKKSSNGLLHAGSSAEGSKDHEHGSRDGAEDIEAQNGIRGNKSRDSVSKGMGSRDIVSKNSAESQASEFSFIGFDDFEASHGRWAQYCPSAFGLNAEHARLKSSILAGNESTRTSYMTLKAIFCPWFDKQSRQKEEFLEEMRLLSRLRHPCITTVMGAVVSSGHDPMLVMEYMEYGSLHDLLHSESMFFSGEICLQILRDIAQGVRYLHASKPPILHGDLKAKNILLDSRFRAKVCDFGLSTKKKHGISGTPLWLAPEYLRGKTEYNTTCDMYSIGIILYELYSRQDPYHGENFKTVLRQICDPRKNHRPPIPPACPPKMVTLMKSLWSPDPFFRPQAKDLDMALMDMNMRDAEPVVPGDQKAMPTTKDMLYQLFPKHIADALLAGQKVEPEQHDLVTVVFAEIIGFQELTKKLPPMKVTNLLDRVFYELDRLAKEFDIFKVETVGQCYMGVTNLAGKQEAFHVKNVALFSLGAIAAVTNIYVDEDDPKHGHAHLRVGFHSGPVVTNVIGSLNPRYGLFGDTVNTASRMESHSVANRIQCSEKSALILMEQDPDILVVKRGKVAIKGKGDMVTYWIGENAVSTRGDEDPSSSPGESGRNDKCVSFGMHNKDATCSIDSSKGYGSGILKKQKKSSG